jgi:hypothetical protein
MNRHVVLALLAFLALPACGPEAVPVSSPATHSVTALGESFTIDSNILGERRVINVYVPPGYATSTGLYPVLYMLDGGMAEDFPHVVGSVDVSTKNAVIRPVIVVGIENTERRHDLVGPTTVREELEAAPNAGGAGRFRMFLRDELKPLIRAHYHTTAESAIIGESLAGLFVVETFIVEPTLFDGYIAASPSVWWNNQEVVRSASQRLAWWTAGRKSLYVATADEKDTQDAVAILATALRIQAPPGVTWVYEPMPDERHSTVFPTAALHGIRTVFAAR